MKKTTIVRSVPSHRSAGARTRGNSTTHSTNSGRVTQKALLPSTVMGSWRRRVRFVLCSLSRAWRTSSVELRSTQVVMTRMNR